MYGGDFTTELVSRFFFHTKAHNVVIRIVSLSVFLAVTASVVIALVAMISAGVN